MEKTCKLAEAQMTFEEWFEICSYCQCEHDSIGVIAVKKMTESAVISGDWYSTQILAYGLGADDEENLAFKMMCETAKTFKDWFEVAHLCESKMCNVPVDDSSYTQTLVDLQQMLEMAKKQMLEIGADYSDWNNALTDVDCEYGLYGFMLDKVMEIIKSPMDCARLYCYELEDKDDVSRKKVLAKFSALSEPFSDWLEIHEAYSKHHNYDQSIKSVVIAKMADSYTTFVEWEKVQELCGQWCYEEILSKSLTNDQWRTFFGLTE